MRVIHILNRCNSVSIKLFIASAVLLNLTLCSKTLMAQQPTKKEMEEMRKAMEEMKADPEMVKAMKEYGIDMKMVENSMNAVEKDGFGAYYEFEEFMTPKKDDARIAIIPKKTLTNAELAAHLVKATKAVDAAFQGDDRKIADQLLSKVSSYHPDSLSAIANGLWMTSNYLPATYFMGKASQKDPNPDNLNNYSAFLLMLGAEELAIPILQKLNKEFPGNSTLLNNIGQAWFGLGDLNRAEKYLDSAILTIAWHSQANMTKAVIQESKGDKAGAVESLKKSVQGGYSITKEDMLRKLGYQLDGKDVDDDFNMPQDPLGFDKWIARIPNFPKNHKEHLALEAEWEMYYKDVEAERAALTEKLNKVNIEVREKMRKEKTDEIDMAKAFAMTKPPYLSAKANHVLKYYSEEKSGKFSRQHSLQIEKANENGELRKKMEDDYHKLFATENAKCVDGEGKPPCPSICPVIVPAWDNLVNITNTNLEKWWNENMNLWARQLEASAYFYQYSVSDQLLIDQNELRLKLMFVEEHLSNIRPALGISPEILLCAEDDDKKSTRHKLADWNDLHCDRNVTYTMPFTGTMNFTCNTTEIHLDPLLLPFEMRYQENLNTNEMLFCSGKIGMGPVKMGGEYDVVQQTGKAEIGYSKDIDKGYIGPVPVEAKAEATVGIEFDKSGVSDFIMEAGVEIEAGDKVASTKIEGKARWSWNAGGSGEAKGSLGGAVGRAIK
jgi:tetratricopeptide (TPR) repeat protein